MEFVWTFAGMMTTLQHTFELFKVTAQHQLRTPSSSKNVIEIPQIWTNVIYHSSSQPYLEKNSFERSDCRKHQQERRQTSMLLLGRGFAANSVEHSLLSTSETFQQTVSQESSGTIKAILFERPSDVATNGLTILTDFRASGDRLLVPDQQH